MQNGFMKREKKTLFNLHNRLDLRLFVKFVKSIQKYSMKKWKKKKQHENSPLWHISERGQEVHLPTLCLDTSDLTNRRHYSS